jgi:hypothetical protein
VDNEIGILETPGIDSAVLNSPSVFPQRAAGMVYDTRQAKRLFPLLGAGGPASTLRVLNFGLSRQPYQG